MKEKREERHGNEIFFFYVVDVCVGKVGLEERGKIVD